MGNNKIAVMCKHTCLHMAMTTSIWFGSERKEEVSVVMELYMTGQISVWRARCGTYVRTAVSSIVKESQLATVKLYSMDNQTESLVLHTHACMHARTHTLQRAHT